MTLGLIAGTVVAQATYGTVNLLDPKILLSILMWAVYLIMLYTRWNAGWRGRRAAYLATGSTVRAAVAALRLQQPKRIIVAVPIAAEPTNAELRSQVEELICLAMPEPFYSVGFWYEDFSQTNDEEIRELLERASKELSPAHQR